MEVRVHSISAGFTSRVYLIEGETGVILVDTGMPHHEAQILRKLRSLSHPTLDLIFITHAHQDHCGSAAALRRITGAPVVIHRADAQAMVQGTMSLGKVRGRGKLLEAVMPLVAPLVRPEPVIPDQLLKDGEILHGGGLEARVLHTPGHTPGSSCLLIEGMAFAGDLLSMLEGPHLQQFFADDWAALPESLHKLQAVGPTWIYTGHGAAPMTGKALQQLQA